MREETLEKHLSRLNHILQCLTELQTDIEYLQDKNEIYYAADFSEIFAYLHYSDKSEEVRGLGLNSENGISSQHHRLGLIHLFNSLTRTENIYLLPPYTVELWAYSKNQAQKTDTYKSTWDNAQQVINKLSPSIVNLLKSLNDEKDLSLNEKDQLLELVKDDFKKICIEIVGFVNWNRQADLLKNLLKEKISFDIGQILEKKQTSPELLKEPTRSDELDVLNHFPERTLYRYYQKLIDSRAILYLREINDLLLPRKAKLVLVTRDQTMRTACQALAKIPNGSFKGCEMFFRAPETVFLDLILSGFEQSSDKMKWLKSSIESLQDIKTQLEEIQQTGNSVKIGKLVGHKEQVVENASKSWDEKINLQLSLAIPQISWLQSGDFNRLLSERHLDGVFEPLMLIKNLLDFVTTKAYREIAVKEVGKLWAEIQFDSLRMLYLKNLGMGNIARLDKILSKISISTESKVNGEVSLLSPFSSMMPIIKFASPRYHKRLEAFKKITLKEIRSPGDLLPLIFEVTTGANEIEDRIFMSFVLGALSLWDDALKMLESPLELDEKDSNYSQALYLRAFLKRKQGENEGNFSRSIICYEMAWRNIEEAANLHPEDPRYLKEYGAIILFYQETWQKFTESSDFDQYTGLGKRGPRSELDLDKGKQILIKALKIQENRRHTADDARLLAEILNNLAYTEVLAENPDFNLAEQTLGKLERHLVEVKQYSPLIQKDLQSFVADTKIMITARRAFTDKNLIVLENCIKELDSLNQTFALTDARKNSNRQHKLLLMKWFSQM